MGARLEEGEAVGASGTEVSGRVDSSKYVGLGGTHPKETSIQRHMPSPGVETTGEKKERLASKQLET